MEMSLRREKNNYRENFSEKRAVAKQALGTAGKSVRKTDRGLLELAGALQTAGHAV